MNYPLRKKEEPKEEVEDAETASGKCQGYAWMQERPDTDVVWGYNSGTLTNSGAGDMHDFYYTWGGRTQTTTGMSKPWKEYNDKIKKVVTFYDCYVLSDVTFEGENISTVNSSFANTPVENKLSLEIN